MHTTIFIPGSRGAGHSELERYLAWLAAGSPAGRCYDVRWRRNGAMSQRFYSRGDRRLPRLIAQLAAHSDVYVGVLLRVRAAGDRSALPAGRVLWADCDSAAATAALTQVPAPSLIVRSGGDGHCHAYWRLSQSIPAQQIGEFNRRLAVALASDRGAVTAPTAILRPPGTWWHKQTPPQPVTVLCRTAGAYAPAEIAETLPAIALPKRRTQLTRDVADGDPLDALTPPSYFALLAGVAVPRNGKVRCPLPDHEDRTPSCMAYPTAREGWYCYGCARGGSIYDLASLMWGIPARGAGWQQLRERLLSVCVNRRAA